MQLTKLSLILCTLFLTCFSLSAQQGVITGTLVDEVSADPLIGAYVFVEGTDKASASDFDGKYKIELPAGTYTLKITYIGFPNKMIEGVIVKEGEITYLDVSLAESAEQMEEIVVKAKVIERSENSVLLLQKKSYKIQDGISSQEMSKLSVSNVAGAMKKITGATVQDGKYLNVRGLGDRYSLAQMDGIALPSVDPYKNSAQLDFIPTNIIENIIASKTFTPDQPGTFTGGNVTIKTKSIPEQETFSAGLSFGYNTVNNLNNKFLRNSRSGLDFLGYDDGSRKLPAEIIKEENAEYLEALVPLIVRLGNEDVATNADRLSTMIDYEFDSQETTSPINHGINLSYGNSFKMKRGGEIGLIFAGKYSRDFIHRENQTNTQYGINGEIRQYGNYIVDKSTESPQINGFAGITYKVNGNHQITLKNLYNHQADISSRKVIGEDGQNIQAPSFKLGRDNTFQELSLNMTSLSGTHILPRVGGLKIEWNGAYIKSRRYEPELAYLSSQWNEETDIEGIPEANVAPPLLFWRDINDNTYSGKVDFTLPIPALFNADLKAGLNVYSKTRNSDETSLNIATANGAPEFNGGNANDFFTANNAGIIGQDDQGRSVFGNYLVDYTNPKNSYTGTSMVSAGYIMSVFKPLDNLKVVAGVRVENTNIFAQSKIVDKIESIEADSSNTGSIKSTDFLPALSLIYNVTDKSNFRLNYSKTIARPSLREIAPFASWDPILSIFFLGNPNLTTTDINNYDARWELFMSRGELVALSVFYKDFNNPISISVKPASNTEFQYVNVQSGYVSGFEIEFRKNLNFISSKLDGFKFGGNFAIIQSEMGIPDNARFIPEKRTFEGQSPFLANANLTYTNLELGIESAISYNYVGRRLSSLGDQAPDNYLNPFNTLNFVISKKIGKYNLKFGATNLLNNSVSESLIYEGQEYITSSFEKGIGFNFGVSYKY